MKITISLLLLGVAVGLVSSINPHRQKINSPLIDAFGVRQRRSPVAGGTSSNTGGNFARVPLEKQEYRPVADQRNYEAAGLQRDQNLRKGEFICGDKICKLEPRISPPPRINGFSMQYPVAL